MKKRLIFTLLFEQGAFVLSRNFRTQRVGDLEWLEKNYDFSKVAFFIDELIILDVSQSDRNISEFAATVRSVAQGCFAPIAAGGGIRSIEDAEILFNSGADKIVVNRALYDDHALVKNLSQRFGQQAVVASLDVARISGSLSLVSNKASTVQSVETILPLLDAGLVGEIYLNSVGKDGTGQGMEQELLNDFLPLIETNVPIILAGGAGKPEHLLESLKHPAVSAAATANLLNFIGAGLRLTRESLIESGIDLAHWNPPPQP